jgi:hypothetical protein
VGFLIKNNARFYFSSFENPYIIDCKIESTILKSSAVQKESTVKPPTISEHNKIIIAFIAKRNNPKVKIVTGSVNMIKIGFTNIFNSPKTNATIIEVEKFIT